MIPVCGILHEVLVFDHYAYGDPLPVYERFATDEDGTNILVFVPCQRITGHQGDHLTADGTRWPK